MRLFTAVDVSGCAEAIADIQEPLRGLSGLNPTDPKQAHVTVKFLGDGPEGGHDLDSLLDALRDGVETAAVDSFELGMSGLGAFPSPEYITVVYLGVEAGSGRLRRLHEAIEAETTAIGYDAERHDYTPHVTLARMNHAGRKERVQEYLESSTSAATTEIESLRLIESTLTDDGPVYETVAEIRLEDASIDRRR
ncbi:MAG: RNA 2',3'-cyclic phosphodiesterase [Natronomonas sp.]